MLYVFMSICFSKRTQSENVSKWAFSCAFSLTETTYRRLIWYTMGMTNSVGRMIDYKSAWQADTSTQVCQKELHKTPLRMVVLSNTSNVNSLALFPRKFPSVWSQRDTKEVAQRSNTVVLLGLHCNLNVFIPFCIVWLSFLILSSRHQSSTCHTASLPTFRLHMPNNLSPGRVKSQC